MRARLEHLPNYRADIPKGYSYLVFVEWGFGWVIDSWHRTKREAAAIANDYNAQHKEADK